MPTVSFVHALQDNYIWMLLSENRRHVLVIDPGEAEPVRQFLQKQRVQLSGILLTHYHQDHIGGVNELVAQYHCPVYGMKRPEFNWLSHPVTAPSNLYVNEMNINLQIYSTPGHTLDHIAFYYAPYLFCGDTLFAGGCGRLFEGSAEQLYQSLMQLMQLPDDTRVYCAHEYTLNNLRFAQTIEPDNTAIAQRILQVTRLREQKLSSLPSTLATEKQTNPFVRCHLASVRKRIADLTQMSIANPVQAFTQLRCLKDQWRAA